MADIFTRIVDGQQVNATNTNAPLIEIETVVNALDADLNTKVGDLTTLGTTPKTSVVAALGTATPTTTAKTVVGAINELDALIGTAASDSGSIGTSIDVDGTLKAGAVDVAGVLADGVVTAAKILDGAIPSPNLVIDPFNELPLYNPTLSNIDGRRRWRTGNGVRTADATSLSGYSIRVPTTAGEGKWLWMDEIGLAVGDVVSGAILARVPTGRSIRLGFAMRDSAGAPTGAFTSDAVVGDDALHFITVNAKTIPALSVSIDLYVYQGSGTGNVDVQGWYLYRGSYAYQYSGAGSLTAGAVAQRWMTTGQFLPQQNLAFDPLNRRLHVDENLDGRTRWYNTSTYITRVDPDANNPFGLPTMRVNSTVAGHNTGRRFWLDEMGLRPGDALSVGMLMLVPTDTTCMVGMCQRTADGTLVADTIVNSAYVVGDNAIHLVSSQMATQTTNAAQRTIQATTAAIDVYIVNYATTGGSGNIDIYGWFIVLGTGLPSTATLTVAPEGMPYQQWIDYPPGQLSYGRQFLRTYIARGAQIKQTAASFAVSAATNAAPIEITTTADHGYQTGNVVRVASVGGNTAANGDWTVTYVDATKFTLDGSTGNGEWTSGGTTTQLFPLRVAVLGDSWVDGAARICDPLAAWLQAKYGDGGVGWVGFGWTTDYPLIARRLTGYSLTCAGTGAWVATISTGKGVDLQHVTSSTVGDKWELSGATWTDATIHYLEQAGGGTIEYQVDSDGWVEVATSGAGDAYKTATITGKTLDPHTLTIRIKAGSTGDVTLFGADLRKAGTGARLLKLGSTGSHASTHWANADATLWTDGLKAFAPHLVIILLGTNDDTSNDTLADFHAGIDTIIDRVQAATMVDPAVAPDVLILTPSDNGNATAPHMAEYVRELRHIAVDQDAACLDAYKLLGPYASANLRGLYTNDIHINSYGGQAITSALCDELLKLG